MMEDFQNNFGPKPPSPQQALFAFRRLCRISINTKPSSPEKDSLIKTVDRFLSSEVAYDIEARKEAGDKINPVIENIIQKSNLHSARYSAKSRQDNSPGIGM